MPHFGADAGFYGNPNVTITAIDTSGGIVCSHTSLELPGFIQVSASAITATGSTRPYEDLHYHWDFGDSAGTETFVHPVTGETVNANAGQYGPEAAYVYRSTSGSPFTITLTIIGKNGGGFTTTNVQQVVTVAAFNASGGEFWFDSVAGLDANSGLSIGAPKQTLGALKTVLATANRKVNLKRNSSWTATGTGQRLDFNNNIRLGSYSSGAKPYLTKGDVQVTALLFCSGSNVVISDMDLHADGVAGGTQVIYDTIIGAAGSINHVYMDNCDFATDGPGTETLWRFQTNATATSQYCGLWNCNFEGPLVPNVGNRAAVLGGPHEWFFVVGCSVVGAGSDTTADHHIYTYTGTHMMYRWLSFGSGPGRNFCLNVNLSLIADGGPAFGDYVMISDCNMTGTERAYDLSNSNGDDTNNFRYAVVQHNAMHDFTTDATMFMASCVTVTIRDNIAWNIAQRWFGPSGTVNDILAAKGYRNKVYVSTNGGSLVYYAVTGAWLQPQEWTYNILQSDSTVANFIDLRTAEQVTAGSVFNFNQYYAPNDADSPDKAWFIAGVAKTLAEWQAAGWDVSGTVANPNWADPDNGDFRAASGYGGRMGVFVATY